LNKTNPANFSTTHKATGPSCSSARFWVTKPYDFGK
jgi:hypothetical protein